MQIAVSASILALAASASASTVYGSLYQYYHANATCDPDIVPTYPEGKALAIGSLDSCAEVVPGVDGAEFKLFKGVPLVPTFSCESPNQMHTTTPLRTA